MSAEHPDDHVRETIRTYILAEFLPGEDAGELKYDTELITGGILDSISVFKLLGFLLQEYGVRLEPHEVANEMHTIDQIASVVESRRSAGG